MTINDAVDRRFLKDDRNSFAEKVSIVLSKPDAEIVNTELRSEKIVTREFWRTEHSDQVQIIDYKKTILANWPKIELLEEYQNCTKAAKKDKSIASHLGVLIGTRDQYIRLDIDEIFKYFLIHLFSNQDSFVINYDKFEQKFKEFLDSFDSEFIRLDAIIMLDRFR